MDQLTNEQLDALFKVANGESLATALRTVYQAGINWGWANPPVVVVDAPPAVVAPPDAPPSDPVA